MIKALVISKTDRQTIHTGLKKTSIQRCEYVAWWLAAVLGHKCCLLMSTWQTSPHSTSQVFLHTKRSSQHHSWLHATVISSNATCNCLRSYLWIHFTTFFEWSLLSAQYHGLWLPETALQKYMKGCFNNVHTLHSRSYSLWLWCLLNNYQRLANVKSICDFSTRCCSFDVNGYTSI